MGVFRDFLRGLKADRELQAVEQGDHRDDEQAGGRIHGDTWTTPGPRGTTVYHQCGLKRGHAGKCLCRYWWCSKPRRP